MMEKQCISVIVPIYNESEVIDTFYTRLSKVMQSIAPYDYEIVFIDDGSLDDSHQKLIE